MITERLTGVVGLAVILGISYLMSDDKKAVKWKPIATGIFLQFVFALFILKTPYGRAVFDGARVFFEEILGYSAKGAQFVFGPLADIPASGKAFGARYGFIFAFQISATIIFMSSLMCVLYYLGIMQKVVYGFAVVMQKLMGTSGSESLASAANIFLGQTEAPLVIRPYLEKMTHSEIMALMVGGMANVAGGVLAAYVGMGIDAGHLLAGSVMSAPATLVIAKLMVPETQVSETAGTCRLTNEKIDHNLIDAACRGAGEGVMLVLNVMAVLIAFIALVAMFNTGIQWVSGKFLATPLTLESLLGYLFMPFAWLMGVPREDVFQIGSLLGIKTVLNEFVAYDVLAQIKSSLNPRSVTIVTYALCGFANFSSIAIQIGGIGTLMPSRRKDLAALGLKSMIAGTFCTFMTATIAGILL
jgi:CNT family concentrative nucleoside transporter